MNTFNANNQLQFHRGDRVQLTRKCSGIPAGTKGTVKGHEGDCYAIEFDEEYKVCHCCGGLCKSGCGRWMYPSDLEPEVTLSGEMTEPNQVQVQIIQTGDKGQIIRTKTLTRDVSWFNNSSPTVDLWFRISKILDDVRKQYNCKVVCVRTSNASEFTRGKVYTFEDGFAKTDSDAIFGPVFNLDDLQETSGCEFVELVE